jgi:hypothetical protein
MNMKPNFEELLKRKNMSTPGQMAGQKQKETTRSEEQKNEKPKIEPPFSGAHVNKIEDAFSQNPINILLAIIGVGACYYIHNLYKENEKLSKENARLKEDFKSLKDELRSEINDLKRESAPKRPKKSIEDCFDVSDVQGYEIKTDEKPEAEKRLVNPFLA